MKVTPVGKNFGSYKPGDPFDLPEKVAQHLIKVGLLAAAADISPRTGKPKRQYLRRDLRAES